MFKNNVSGDEANCFVYYNNDGKVNFIYELSIFNKLHDKQNYQKITGRNWLLVFI